MLDGPDEIEWIDLALVLNRPPEEVAWESRPTGTAWLIDVLRTLAERRLADLPRVTAAPEEVRERTATELDAALARLRAVRQSYWERDWRREHSGMGRYPENELWEAVEGYLDLLDATEGPAC
jgi:hypothetical protein